MRKLLWLIVCLMTMVGAKAHNTHYPTYTEDGITYISTGIDKNGKFAGWQVLKVDKPNSRTIVIPAEITIDGEKFGVGLIRENAFSTCASLDSLIISEGLVIGNWYNTFKGCKQLEYLYYSNGGYQIKANWLDGKGCVHDMDYWGLSCKTFETSVGCAEKPFWERVGDSLEKLIIKEGNNRIVATMSLCKKLKTIVCYSTTPPRVDAAAGNTYSCEDAKFNSNQWSTITLYVPRESLEKYYFDRVWGEIDNIYAIDEMSEVAGTKDNEIIDITGDIITSDTNEGDINKDGKVNVADIVSLVNIVMKKQ